MFLKISRKTLAIKPKAGSFNEKGCLTNFKNYYTVENLRLPISTFKEFAEAHKIYRDNSLNKRLKKKQTGSDDNLEILQRIFRLHIQRIPIFGINSVDIYLFEVKIKILFTKTYLH